MIIKSISIQGDGYVLCKSRFYTVHDVLNAVDETEKNKVYGFFTGVNTLIGDIDSGNWGISYLLSMYPYEKKENLIFSPLTAVVNNETMPLDELWKYTCYMDLIYPLFHTKKKVKHLVMHGIKKSGISCSAEEIRNLFHIDKERFERPLTGMGNELYRALAAIGYCHEKQVFCFPWFSRKRFNSYHNQMPDLLNILESLGTITILPLGKT